MKATIKNILSSLRCARLFPRRYDTPQGLKMDYWGEVLREYGNMEKYILGHSSHWFIVEYKDGNKELAYLRVLKGGMLSGKYPAIYRGFIPRMVIYGTFCHYKSVRPAF